MSNTISSLANIFRSIAWLAVVALLGAGGWVGYRVIDERAAVDRALKEKTEQLAAKIAEVERLTQENQKLNLALRLLKVDHRVAEISVREQHEEDGHLVTQFQFVELGKDGGPVGERKTFTVEGDTVYVDAWVIKYADDLVEKNDPLRSTAVCLFRRIFGEFQQPSAGFALDSAGSRPSVYSQGNELSPLERDMWANFWEYANSPSKAQAAGVRAAHGEAPSMRLQPGKRYRVELRSSGGLSIIPEGDAPKPAT